MKYSICKNVVILTIINICFNVNLGLAKIKDHCPNRHLENDWVGSDNSCKKSSPKDLKSSKKMRIEQELENKKDKKKRIIEALKEIAKENSESKFIVKCAELNRVHLSIRKKECQLGLPASNME